jgi:hypothetical protein
MRSTVAFSNLFLALPRREKVFHPLLGPRSGPRKRHCVVKSIEASVLLDRKVVINCASISPCSSFDTLNRVLTCGSPCDLNQQATFACELSGLSFNKLSLLGSGEFVPVVVRRWVWAWLRGHRQCCPL